MGPKSRERGLKRVAAKRIHVTRFKLLFLCMSLSKTAAHFWATCIGNTLTMQKARGKFPRGLVVSASAPLQRLLKGIASKRIYATRFRLSFLCMPLSQNRCALLGDMH